MEKLKDKLIMVCFIILVVFLYIMLSIAIFGLLYWVDEILQIQIFYSVKLIVSLIVSACIFIFHYEY